YFSGDTVYLPELAKMRQTYHISVAHLNLGKAAVGGMPPITMDGEQGVLLFKDIDGDLLIPLHYEGWDHFTEGRDGSETAFKNAGISGKVKWLTPGLATKKF